MISTASFTILLLECSSLQSVFQRASTDELKTAAASSFQSQEPRLDILMNNAGIMAQPPGLTQEGYELQFCTNHVGHQLFTSLLLPTLTKTASEPDSDVRIINLSSEGHRLAPPNGIDFTTLKTNMQGKSSQIGSHSTLDHFPPPAALFDLIHSDHHKLPAYFTITRYGQSKLANILFTRELARRYPAITSVSIHPGGCNTNIQDAFRGAHSWFGMMKPVTLLFLKTAVEGSLNQVWAATAPVEGKSTVGTARSDLKKVKQGCYYVPVASENAGTKQSRDGDLARELWEWAETEIAPFCE